MRRTEWLGVPSEAQRREERRAEARLADGLQRLDEAKRYHLNLLTREQRALHRHLIAIKTGNRWKGFNAVGLRASHQEYSHPAVSYTKTLLPIIPPASRESEKHRSAKSQSICTLKARVQEFIGSGESRADNSAVPLSLPHLKPQASCALPPAASEHEGGKERKWEGQKGTHRDKEGKRFVLETERFRPKDTQRQNEFVVEREIEKGEEMNGTMLSPSPVSPLSEFFAPDGRLRMVHTLPNFAQALAEARKARYIRHRGQPLSERELSVREIFSRNSKDPSNSTH